MTDDSPASEQSATSSVTEAIYQARWVSLVAVVFSGLGACLMMLVGAFSTIEEPAPAAVRERRRPPSPSGGSFPPWTSPT